MGQIPAADKMVSSLIIAPSVGQDFDADELRICLFNDLPLGISNQFSVQISNVITGFFGNAGLGLGE